MAIAVTPPIVLLQITTSPCKCSDSLLCKNFNDQIWPIHKCIRRQFSVSQWSEIHRLEGHAGNNNLGLPLGWHTCLSKQVPILSHCLPGSLPHQLPKCKAQGQYQGFPCTCHFSWLTPSAGSLWQFPENEVKAKNAGSRFLNEDGCYWWHRVVGRQIWHEKKCVQRGWQ